MIDVNYIKSDKKELDQRLFFNNEDCLEIKPFHKTIAHLLSDAKIFSSTSDAKRNGWDKPLPEGFSQFTIGKIKKKITIFNEKKEK